MMKMSPARKHPRRLRGNSWRRSSSPPRMSGESHRLAVIFNKLANVSSAGMRSASATDFKDGLPKKVDGIDKLREQLVGKKTAKMMQKNQSPAGSLAVGLTKPKLEKKKLPLEESDD